MTVNAQGLNCSLVSQVQLTRALADDVTAARFGLASVHVSGMRAFWVTSLPTSGACQAPRVTLCK
jgi:hypothetical protein